MCVFFNLRVCVITCVCVCVIAQACGEAAVGVEPQHGAPDGRPGHLLQLPRTQSCRESLSLGAFSDSLPRSTYGVMARCSALFTHNAARYETLSERCALAYENNIAKLS